MTVIKILFGLAAAFIVGIIAFVYSGVYNIAADDPHTAPVSWVLEKTRIQSIARRADSIQVPDDLKNMQRIERGARPYAAMCQSCHLGPGVEPTLVYTGLYPQPPQLSEHAAHSSPESLFWITKHGIKMTGMPAWGKTHGDEELWDIVAFIQKMPELSSEQYKQITKGADTVVSPSETHGEGASHSH